jgi:hypothetical protein
MHVSNSNSSTANLNSVPGSSNVKGGSTSGTSTFQSLLSQLNTFVDGSPGDQMETEILAQLGISKEDLKNMTPADRAKVEEKIKEMLKQETQAKMEASQGAKAIANDPLI